MFKPPPPNTSPPPPNHQSSSCLQCPSADPRLFCLHQPPDRQPGRWRRGERVMALAVQSLGQGVCVVPLCVCVCVALYCFFFLRCVREYFSHFCRVGKRKCMCVFKYISVCLHVYKQRVCVGVTKAKVEVLRGSLGCGWLLPKLQQPKNTAVNKVRLSI